MGNMKDDVRLSALIAIFSFPALGGFLFGWDIGVTTYALTQLAGDAAGVPWGRVLSQNSALEGFWTSSSVGGALLGTLIVYRVEEVLGRRRELIAAALLYISGAAIEMLSSISRLGSEGGLVTCIVGRWIYGLGIGFAMHAAPAYISETSPSSVRGLLISAKEAAVVFGILAGNVAGFLFKDVMGGWKWSFGIAIPVALVMLLGVYTLPSSPRWLALRGRLDEAHTSLRFAHARGASEEMSRIQDNVDTIRQQPKQSPFQRRYAWPLSVGAGCVILQQTTGQPSVLYYTNQIFSTMGIADAGTLSLGAFKVLATLAAVMTVERFGRKRLLLVGTLLMLAALLLLTGGFWNYKGSGTDVRNGFIILAFLLYIGGYQVGFGPISWILVSEIFGLEVRGQMVAVCTSLNFLFNLIVTFVFDPVRGAIGSAGTFLIFVIVDALALVFIVTYVPETKGLKLEQIEELFASKGHEKMSLRQRPAPPGSPLPAQESVQRLLPTRRGEVRKASSGSSSTSM